MTSMDVLNVFSLQLVLQYSPVFVLCPVCSYYGYKLDTESKNLTLALEDVFQKLF